MAKKKRRRSSLQRRDSTGRSAEDERRESSDAKGGTNWLLIGGVAAGVLLLMVMAFGAIIYPAVRSARAAARRAQSLNNLHNIGVFGVHDYAQHHAGELPRGTLRSESGEALHGWAAQIVGGADPSLSLDVTVPWDGPVNAETTKTVVPMFLYPGVEETDAQGFALSSYAGNVHVMGDHDPLTLDEISRGDGVTSTMLVAEVGTDLRPWGHPENYRNPAKGFGTTGEQFGPAIPDAGVVHVLMCDGSARSISEWVSPDVLRQLGTPDGRRQGEALLDPSSY